MFRGISITACSLLVAGFCVSGTPLLAEESSDSYKVLAKQGSGFNVSSVQFFLDKGDKSIENGDLIEARKHFDNARTIAKKLLSFYRDLNGSFRGLDARVPREMDAKGRQTLQLLAKVNLRLAALFRRQNQPEVAVPLLVEVVKLMTPPSPEGKKAYQSLLELGFVETPYRSKR